MVYLKFCQKKVYFARDSIYLANLNPVYCNPLSGEDFIIKFCYINNKINVKNP